MEMNTEKPESFANPDVDESLVSSVREYFRSEGQSYPWDAICSVSESEGVSKKEVREAVRKIHLSNELVHAPPFVGEMQLVESSG